MIKVVAGCVFYFIMNGHMHTIMVSGNLIREEEKVYIVDISNAADMLQLDKGKNYSAVPFNKEDCEIGKVHPNHTKADIDYYDSLMKPKHYSDSFDELTEAGLK